MFSSIFLIISYVSLLFANGWQSEISEIQLCDGNIYFEMVLTTLHYDPPTPLESYTFKSKINNERNKNNLDAEIIASCEKYDAVNCEAVSDLIHRKYDIFLTRLKDEEERGITVTTKSCPSISIIDLGYFDHQQSGKFLPYSPTDFNNDNAYHIASPGCVNNKPASSETTIVSGYWRVSGNKYQTREHPYPHEEWMDNSLSLQMPYLFFTNQATVDLIREKRKGIPTLIALREPSSFETYSSYQADWIHEQHVPSAELATIWLEKINLMYLATLMTNSTYYAWVDAGLGAFRRQKFPQEEWSLDVLQSLPPRRLSYAQASGTYHSFAAGVMVAHRDVIPIIHRLFYAEYRRCAETVQDWRCGSEQYILSNIRDKNPHMFHAMSYEYSDIRNLWAHRYMFRITP